MVMPTAKWQMILETLERASESVRHPENIMVLKTRLVIGYPEDDRMVQVGLIHVNIIENLQRA